MEEITLVWRKEGEEDVSFKYRPHRPNCGLVLDEDTHANLHYIGRGWQDTFGKLCFFNGQEVPKRLKFAFDQAIVHAQAYHAGRRVQHCPLCTGEKAWPELTAEEITSI